MFKVEGRACEEGWNGWWKCPESVRRMCKYYFYLIWFWTFIITSYKICEIVYDDLIFSVLPYIISGDSISIFWNF